MLKYITKQEYEKLLGAKSIPDNFDNLVIEASHIINNDYIVDENNISEEVKYTTSKIVELLNEYSQKKSEIGVLQSTNIEGWSESYKTDEEIKNTLEASINDILKLYLITTKRKTKGVVLYE